MNKQQQDNSNSKQDSNKPRRKRPRSIVIVGRRWFDKKYGNTYFTTQAFIDGELWDNPNEGVDYGYGNHYAYHTMMMLEEKGDERFIIPKRERSKHTNLPEGFHAYSQRTGIKVTFTASDVARKKDLTHF